MATNIRIIHAREFIKATPEGQFDLNKMKELLVEIASAPAPVGDYEILVDLRKAQVELSITDSYFLVAELNNLRRAFSRKTAVLCPLERFDHAGFFALCAQNRGFQVKPFTAAGDAIEWLIGAEQES